MIHSLRRLKDAALQLVYPQVCIACGEESVDGFCWGCSREVEVIMEPFCDRCGMPIPGMVDIAYTCQRCDEQDPWFRVARSALRFDGATRQAVHGLKYRSALWLVKGLTDYLEASANARLQGDDYDVITFVPLHSRRFRERGFNQAERLACELAGRLNTPCKSLLKRVRETPSQTRLSVKARRENVRNAFQLRGKKPVEGQQVLLVDDVMTSGATVSEVSRVLVEAGATVDVLTVARG